MFSLGVAAWSVYGACLLRRSLHMLQLEGYQTARFVRWWLRRPTRITPTRQAAASTVGLLLASLAAERPGKWTLLAQLGWSVLGAYLAQGTHFPSAKKPLVMTARARRLVAGEAVIGLALAAYSLSPTPQLPRKRPRDWSRVAVLLSAATLVTPLITAAANLLLFPGEEALRRYYLRDAAARLRRRRMTVVAVAGSYGKTSTKEFIATILSAQYAVLKPPGSYNTPMGLSRVIREQLTPEHDVLVAELGDWVPGDIALLCGLLRPSVGVLTNIGPEHLERFKTMDRVVASKFELLEALPPEGTAVINQDDEAVRRLGDRTPAARVMRYGLHDEGAQVRARDVRTTRDGLQFIVQADGHGEAAFNVAVLGRHNVANLLAATTTALALGMSLDDVAEAAGRIEPVEHRLQPIRGEGGVLVIDDAFNANPRGAAAALEVLAELESPAASRRILVTPGMVELAEREFEENRRFGRQAARVCDEVILVGQERAAPLVAGLRDEGFPDERLHVVGDLAEATAQLSTLVRAGDIVLFENDLPDTYADVSTEPLRRRAIPNGATTAEPLPLGERSFLHVDGLRLAYRESGQGRSSPPVLLLHGWGASLDALTSLQSCLEAERRVIAFDLPGFGRSDPPPAPWSSVEYAGFLDKALEGLGLARVSLIGHSRGGAIAIVLAARRPDLVHRLVLVNSAGLRPARSLIYRARVAAYKAARRLVGRSPLSEWLTQRFGSADYRAAGPLRSTLVRMVNEDLRPFLPRVAAPTLLIWGDKDEETPLADASIMEREIPDAGLIVLPGAGHFSYTDDLPRFCRVVGYFLQS